MTTVNDSYAIGAAVWVKIFSRIWWPGTVVDEKSIPDDLKAFKEGLKQCIAVVKFINEEKYEVVESPNKILMYSCEKKIEFIEKGLTLSKMQKKGQKIVGNCNMDNFFDDIRSMESYIDDGDVNIIENLEIQHMEREERRKSVKELFTPSSTKKSKKKVEGKKSLPALKPSKIEKSPKTVKLEPKTSRNSKSIVSKKSTPIQTFKNSGTTPSGNFTCYLKSGCNYTTKSFDILKRHMLIHDKNTEEEKTKKKSTPKSKKRKNLKTKSPDLKKQKLQEELLKDWNDGDDEDILFDTSNNVPTTTEHVKMKATNEVEVTIKNVWPTVCKPSTSAIKDTNTSTTDENDYSSGSVCPAKVIETTREVFTNDIVPELREEVRLLNCDTGSTTGDEINDTSEVLLVKTESTLDQISKLEESLSGFSTGINKLNASNVIDTQKKTDVIENQNICIENSEVVKSEKIADDLVIIDKDIIPNNNVSKCSDLDSSVMIDSEDWIKQHGWETFPAEEIKQAEFLFDLQAKPLPYTEHWSREGAKFETHEFSTNRFIDEEAPSSYPRLISFRVPKSKDPSVSIEEMKKNPKFQALMKAVSEGKTLKLCFTGGPPIISASYDNMLGRLKPEVKLVEPEEIIDLDESL